ncbi:hypothetical protein [Prochlorococcus marinus]|uniref:hypothetical protein n=1 Tax=Prochlorococcus marinus TaxID=1219 RepID=UPI001ADB82DD|nr:hypothetical protein [Prochlorococcus marinus]MBO8217702.1 hypothetical protein [Prochlorococcus marinus XMU1405]MBW3040865.1 hypothetical protein [Prochlorococcus marinus str. MU1405]MBW3048325.1 hypothetical protein [Prochlorococcus marinus str. MU1406]
MLKINIIWLCAYNIKKCINDIEALYSIKKKIDKNINLNLFIADRRREGLNVEVYHKDFKGRYNIFYSSKVRSHQKDYYYLTKNFYSNFTLSLTDDDKIHIESLVNFLNILQKNQKEKIVLAIPSDPSIKTNNKLEPNKKYNFWEYQFQRGPNLAYYAAISSNNLFNTCSQFVKYKTDIWIHPMYDQCFIWSILKRGKYKIKTVKSYYMNYDNSNWASRKKSLETVEKHKLKYKINQTQEVLAFRDVLYIYSNNKLDCQILIWFFYLVYRNLRYYRNPFKTINCIFNLAFYFLNFRK